MDGAACVKKAYEFILHNDFESAIYWFEKAIELEPQVAEYYYRCSITCARSGKWLKAMDYAQKSIQLDPTHEEYAYHTKVIEAKLLYLSAKKAISIRPPDWEKAIIQLEKAVELDSLNFEVYYTLSLVYDATANVEKALVCAREALKLSPEHAAARTLFAELKRKYRKLSK